MFDEDSPLYLLDSQEGRKLSREQIEVPDNALLVKIDNAISVFLRIQGQEYSGNLVTVDELLPYLGGSIQTAADALPPSVKDILRQEFSTSNIIEALTAEIAEFISIAILGFRGVLGHLNIFPEAMKEKEDVLDCLTANICRYISIPLNAYSLLLEGFGRVLVFRMLVFCDFASAILVQQPRRIESVHPARALVRFYEIISEIPLESFVDGIRSERYRSLRMLNSTLEKVLSELNCSESDISKDKIQKASDETVAEQFQTSKSRIQETTSLLSAYINMVKELHE